MPLLVNKKNSEPLYNNAEFYDEWKNFDVPNADVCYAYERFTGQKVFVSNPKLDTLKLTLDIPGQEARSALLEKVEGSKYASLSSSFDANDPSKYGKYKNTIVLESSPTSAILRTTSVSQVTQRFAQLQFHASEWSGEQIQQLFVQLMELSGGYWTQHYLWNEAKTLRADWFVDFIGVSPAELAIWKKSGTRGSQLYIAPTEGVETIQVNPKSMGKKAKAKKGQHNASKAYVYNKTVQMPALDGKITRIEFRTFKEKNSIQQHVASAGKWGVFKPYMFLDFAAIKPSNFSDHEWRMFGDSCRIRGVDNAVCLLPLDAQEQAQQCLKEIEAYCWRLDDLKKGMSKEQSRFKFTPS